MSIELDVFTSERGKCEVFRAYQSVLARWTVPYAEIDVPTRFGTTHVIVSGPKDGPPVVLLHALFATATSWYRTAETLSEEYRVYAVDIVGEANKSRPTRPMLSLDDFLAWFTELIDSLAIPKMFLVGNSFGAFIAAYYAMRLPHRVCKLVLVGPAATIHAMPAFYFHMFIPKALYLLSPWLPGHRRVVQYSVDWMHAGLAQDPVWTELFLLTMQYGRMTTRVFPRVYTKEELSQIRTRVLLVLGNRERIYPVEAAVRGARRLMPNIEIEIIPDGHHITALARPELVNNAIVRFFKNNAAGLDSA